MTIFILALGAWAGAALIIAGLWALYKGLERRHFPDMQEGYYLSFKQDVRRPKRPGCVSLSEIEGD